MTRTRGRRPLACHHEAGHTLVGRGAFTATFFLVALVEIGGELVRLGEI